MNIVPGDQKREEGTSSQASNEDIRPTGEAGGIIKPTTTSSITTGNLHFK